MHATSPTRCPAQSIFREKAGGHDRRATPAQEADGQTAGDAVVIPAVGRLSRDTTDFLVVARDMHPRRPRFARRTGCR
jgi:hypothetical protein